VNENEPFLDSTLDDNEGLGQKLFKLRDYTPIPLLLLLFLVQKPTILSATLGCLLICCGELFRIYSVAFIGGISRTRSESLGEQLVTSGPFQWMRNPLYVGNFFITLGISLFSGRLWFSVITVAFFCFQYYLIVGFEEQLLAKKFGAAYDVYRAKVPAWLPNKLPALDDVEWPTSFSAAIRSEKRTLGAIALVLTLVNFFA
jgi:protein-S-isoprenylcysteine O-methyltransferase Ste14